MSFWVSVELRATALFACLLIIACSCCLFMLAVLVVALSCFPSLFCITILILVLQNYQFYSAFACQGLTASHLAFLLSCENGLAVGVISVLFFLWNLQLFSCDLFPDIQSSLSFFVNLEEALQKLRV